MKPGPARFDYTLDFRTIDFRQQPELYRVGKGEQGVLLVEPYKGERHRLATPRLRPAEEAASGEIRKAMN